MRCLLTSLAFSAALGSCASAPPSEDSIRLAAETGTDTDEYQVERRRFEGPGYLCGWSFALNLAGDETATRVDPGLDFVTYQVVDQHGGFVLYEGNAPQPADRIVKAGGRFPSVIAIHLDPGRPKSDAAAIEKRLALGDRRSAICKPTAATEG
jgi:hypothetical protein